jgi:hypothetical protein
MNPKFSANPDVSRTAPRGIRESLLSFVRQACGG